MGRTGIPAFAPYQVFAPQQEYELLQHHSFRRADPSPPASSAGCRQFLDGHVGSAVTDGNLRETHIMFARSLASSSHWNGLVLGGIFMAVRGKYSR